MRDRLYEKEKEDKEKEERQEAVNLHMKYVIHELLVELNWDDLDYNREEVKEMIKKALK